MELLTALSLLTASVGSVTAALVSWQTWKDMRDVKKQLTKYGLMQSSSQEPMIPDDTEWGS